MSFHANFADDIGSGEGDWEVRQTDQLDSIEDLRKRESFRLHKLEAFSQMF